MRSMPSLKSCSATAVAPRRVARSAASFTRFARSAPEKPGVSAAIFSGSTSAASVTFFRCTFEDRDPALLVRPVDEHLPVEAPGAQQRRVEDLGPVGRGEQDEAARGVEAVELDQELVERLLLLVVAADAVRAAGAAERVELVDEDDRRRELARLLEEIADARRPDADEHLDELRAVDREERHAGLAGHRAGEQGLAGAGRADEQDALRQPRRRAGRSPSGS